MSGIHELIHVKCLLSVQGWLWLLFKIRSWPQPGKDHFKSSPIQKNPVQETPHSPVLHPVMAIIEIAFCSTTYDYFIIEPLLSTGPVPRTSHLLLYLNLTTQYV